MTLSRLLLLWLVIVIAYFAPPIWQPINVFLLILVFVTDGLDGYIARKRGESSIIGAMLDIAADRIVELSLWVVLAHLQLIPVWVTLVYVTRGILVDAIRAGEAQQAHREPFAMMETPLGQWLVAGKFMRIFYAVIKAVAFCWWMLMLPLPELIPEIWLEWAWLLQGIGMTLVYFAVAICLMRGIPVVFEFIQQHRQRGATA